MKKIFLAFTLAFTLALAGCQTTQPTIIVHKNVVILPDNSMYNCPILSKFPDPKTLKDSEVAKLIVTLYKNNTVCRHSIDAIKKYLEDSKQTLEAEELDKILKN